MYFELTKLKSFAVVLLRRYALKNVVEGKSLLETTGSEVLQHIQKMLLFSLSNEQELSVRSKVADTTSQIGSLLMRKKGIWSLHSSLARVISN
jgi:hypothetical protein